MSPNSDATSNTWIDPDDAPELTDAELAEGELWHGDTFVRRVGRPKGSGTKDLVSLRLDRDIINRFRESGPGWQTRINDTLRAALDGGGAADRRLARQRRVRRGSRREELLNLIRDSNGLSRAEILQRMGLEGDKTGEMSVSEALSDLTEGHQVRLE